MKITTMQRLSTAEQIEAVKKEIALRETTYPAYIAADRMTQGAADASLKTMRDNLARLEAGDV